MAGRTCLERVALSCCRPDASPPPPSLFCAKKLGGIPVNWSNKAGQTALHVAALWANVKVRDGGVAYDRTGSHRSRLNSEKGLFHRSSSIIIFLKCEGIYGMVSVQFVLGYTPADAERLRYA